MRTRPIDLPRRIRRPGMLEGGDGSTLSLDFTAMSGLDSRFTFSRASTATFINSSGLVESAANGVARFDHDPATLAPRGLLIEGSVTNLCLRSEDFGNASWQVDNSGATNPVVSTVSQTAPNGASSVNRVTLNKTGGTFSRLYQAITGTAGQTYTLSVWMKANTANGGAATQNVSLRIGGSNGVNCVVTTTWQRFTHPAFAISGTDANFQLLLWDNVPANDETADVLIWGAQVELGSGASSYTPTGSGTVQRAADSCSLAASASWLNTASGTFVVNSHRGDFGSQDRMAFTSDYASGRWLGVFNSSNTVYLSWWNGSINRTTGSTINKTAYTYGQTTGSGATLQLPVSLCVNASSVATGTFGNGTTNGADVPNPVNWTNFVIGAASSAAPYTTANRDFLNNCVRSVKYWPTVLPDAQLQALTQ